MESEEPAHDMSDLIGLPANDSMTKAADESFEVTAKVPSPFDMDVSRGENTLDYEVC